MRFVKGDKKIPFYNKEGKKPAVNSAQQMPEQPKEVVPPVDMPKKVEITIDNSPVLKRGKPGSVTNVLNNVKKGRIDKAEPVKPVKPIDQPVKQQVEKPIEKKVLADNIPEELQPITIELIKDNVKDSTDVKVNPFTEKLKQMDEVAPLNDKKGSRRKTTDKDNKKSEPSNAKKKSRVALISAVVGFCFLLMVGSVLALWHFSGGNPSSFFGVAVVTQTTVEADEAAVLPTGTPVIEYQLLNNAESSQTQGIDLSLASAEDLLEIRVVDDTGTPITGIPFTITLIDPKGQKSIHTITDETGFLEIDELEEEGSYIAILHPSDGYPAIKPKIVDVKLTIDTNPLDEEDLEDLIVDESDIDISQEDAEFNGSSPPVDSNGTAPPPATDLGDELPSEGGTTTPSTEAVYYTPKTADSEFTVTTGTYANRTFKFITDAEGKIIGAEEIISTVTTASFNISTGLLGSLFTKTSDEIIPINSSPAEGGISSSVLSSSTSASSSSTPSSSSVSTPSSSSSSSTSIPSSSSSSVSVPSSSIPSSSSSTTTPQITTKPVPESELFNGSGTNRVMNEPFASFATKHEPEPEVTIKTGWHGDYYYDANGNMVKDGRYIIGGVEYYFGADGKALEITAGDGIDVSKWQGVIDWNAVAASGVDFAIIRAGYRGYSTGKLVEDPYFRTNLNGAIAAGLDVGVYFFTQAITVQEAIEEASFCLQLTAGYSLAYGITFDTEYQSGGHANNISKAVRTQITNAFCDTVRNGGKIPMVYASKSWFLNQLDYSAIDHNRIWLAHYTAQTDFAYRYDIWQYTSTGRCPGIAGNVDYNYSYKR